MKSIIILVIIAITTSKYTLKIYEPPDCNYCKLAVSQIQKLVKDNHWYQTLDVVIIDCQYDSHQCRDLMNKPLLALYDGNRKIKEVGGVRSKFYFRDWIAEVVQKNIVEIGDVSPTDGDKYRRIQVKNKQDVVAFYWNQVNRLAKMEKDKPNILAQAFSNKVSEEQGQQGKSEAKPDPTSREQQNNGNFEGELRKLIMIGSPILLAAMLLAVLKATICQKRKQNQSIQISSQED